MKTCNKCGVEKDISEFYLIKKTGNHYGYCKACKLKQSEEARKRNPEGTKANSKRAYYKLKEDEGRYRKRLNWHSEWSKKNKDRISKLYNEQAKLYRKKNADKIRERRKKWLEKNPEKEKGYKLRYYLKKKRIAHTLKEISSFFINKCWPYTTEGKNEVSAEMREIMGDINPIQKNSFLSMPNLGRELNLLQDVIKFEDSVGIERDAKLFRSIQRAFAKFFPTMKVEKDCIDNYSINTNNVFDVAHLDYNGFLTDSHIKAAKKLIDDGTMTFVTLNMHQRFEKMEMFRPIEQLTSIGNVVFEKEYYGKRKCPMITIGMTA